MPPSQLGAALGVHSGSPQSSSSATPASRPPRRQPWPLISIIVLVTGFAWLSWERWLPPTEVRVARVEVVRQLNSGQQAAEKSATAGPATTLFQAAGWVEADPFVIRATALVSGVVSSVAVTEGQSVRAGQELATLDQANFQFELEMAQANFMRAESEHAVEAAAINVLRAERARLPDRIAATTAQLAEQQDRWQRLQTAGPSINAGLLRQAELQTQALQHTVQDITGSTAVLDAQLRQAEANMAVHHAHVQQSQVAVNQARLNLERSVIRAPVDGIIQKLYALPGRKQMLESDMPTSATVADMFDPQQLQVRVDVALADVAGLAIGQQVLISSEAFPDQTFTGTVSKIEGQADIARNTLQAKVRIDQPPVGMRPDMLCRAQFLRATSSTATGGESLASTGNFRLLIPRSAVDDRHDTTIDAWMVDEQQRARTCSLVLGPAQGDYVILQSGLSAGAWIIIDPPASLQDGHTVRVQELP